MNCVLDSSLALAWGLPDEASSHADRMLAHLSKDSNLWVPPLWWYEISNALTVALRRRRLKEADVMRLVELYGHLPIQTDSHLNAEVAWRFHALAREHNLSAYDAAYLELAQRRGLGLASLDQRLLNAARDAGVDLIHI